MRDVARERDRVTLFKLIGDGTDVVGDIALEQKYALCPGVLIALRLGCARAKLDPDHLEGPLQIRGQQLEHCVLARHQPLSIAATDDETVLGSIAPEERPDRYLERLCKLGHGLVRRVADAALKLAEEPDADAGSRSDLFERLPMTASQNPELAAERQQLFAGSSRRVRVARFGGPGPAGPVVQGRNRRRRLIDYSLRRSMRNVLRPSIRTRAQALANSFRFSVIQAQMFNGSIPSGI